MRSTFVYPKISYQGKKVHCAYTGVGLPVVFLHGFLEDSSMWDGFHSMLAELPVQAIFIDLPGHGRTEVMSEVHTMEMMADMVDHVLQEIQVKNPMMIGHSMGGYAALAYAENYPEKLRGLCLYHSHGKADAPQKKLDRKRMIKVIRRNVSVFINEAIPNLFAPENLPKYPKEINELKQKALKTPLDGIAACSLGMAERPDRSAIFKAFQGPKSVITGDNDPVIPLAWLEALVDQKENPELDIMTNTGHMSFIESKEAALMFVSKWIELGIS